MNTTPEATPEAALSARRDTIPDPIPEMIRGAALYRRFLDPAAQMALLADVRAIAAAAPLVRHVTPGGRAMSVRMTAAGRCGWVSDRTGYRYAPRHPAGGAWPPIPARVLAVWAAVSFWPAPPDSCLVNWYDPTARMGLHQDRDEGDLTAPVVSISLGDTGVFRLGGVTRGGRTARIDLQSGDVIVLGGEARLAHHGIDRILPGTSTLLAQPGRINLTLRVVA